MSSIHVNILLDLTNQNLIAHKLLLWSQKHSKLHLICWRMSEYEDLAGYLKQSKSSYGVMPSYESEGRAIIAFLRKLNLLRVATLTQNEPRMYLPLLMFEWQDIKISTTHMIPFNNFYGLYNEPCFEDSNVENIKRLLPKIYKSFGAPVMILSTEVCWSSLILTVAEHFRMAR